MDAINAINGVLWSVPMLILCFAAGIYFTFMYKFVQVRKIPTQLHLLFNGQASDKGMSSFQAFCLAIAGRVGTGNIAGVATGIAYGGPGALFWMWMMAIIGAATSFTECTMAQLYKGEVDNEYRGGIAFYLGHGIHKSIGYFYALVMVIAEFAMFGIQSHEISMAAQNAFHIPTVATGVVLTVLLGVIIFGGAKRIAAVANLVVPFMAIAYVIIALLILLVNIKTIPHTFAVIFQSAFSGGSVAGGMIGSAIMWGVRRGVYSNEAGMATATQSAAAAEVSHPVKQGLVQSFSVYIDTLFVCTATGLMLISTNAFNVLDGEGGIIYNGGVLPEAIATDPGAMWTQTAVNTLIPIGTQFVAIALFFFAFTTLMNMSYNCESAVTFFFEKSGTMPGWVYVIVRLGILATVFIGTIVSGAQIWAVGDTGCGFLIWGNIFCLLFMAPRIRRLLIDYEKQEQEGKDPIFNPDDFPELGELKHWRNAYEGYESGKLVN